MWSLQNLNDSSLDKETSIPTMKTTKQDHNFKQRKRQHPNLTTTQLKTHRTNCDFQKTNRETSNKVNKRLTRKETLSMASWTMVLAIFLCIFASVSLTVVAEKSETVYRRDFSSSLQEDSENFVAGPKQHFFQHNSLLHRKKRSKSKNLTFLDFIVKLKQQSPSLHRKRRKRSTGDENSVTKGKVKYF